MERKLVCKIKDSFVTSILKMIGFSEGESNVIIADKASDNLSNIHNFKTILIPLYDANEYIRRRLGSDYGRENQ